MHSKRRMVTLPAGAMDRLTRRVDMDKKQMEARSFDLFQEGFNCAEAISAAIVEWHGAGAMGPMPKVATAFGGGIGGAKCETCGALTGGVIALGWVFGRTQPGADKQKAYALAVEFRTRFLNAFGSTHCQTILDAFGKQENMIECKRMTGMAAGILFDIMQEEKESRL